MRYGKLLVSLWVCAGLAVLGMLMSIASASNSNLAALAPYQHIFDDLHLANGSSESIATASIDKARRLVAEFRLGAKCSDTNCSISSKRVLRDSDWLVLASVEQAHNNYANAGQALANAGAVSYLLQDPNAAAHLPLLAEDKASLARSILALAGNQVRNGENSSINSLAALVRRLAGDDAQIIAQSYQIEALSSEIRQDDQSAFAAMRTALDIVPPDVEDERLNKLYEYATQIVVANKCLYDPDRRLPSLVAFYAAVHTDLYEQCVRLLLTSALQSVPPPERAYLWLRSAIWDSMQGRPNYAKEEFDNAVKLGVSPAWRHYFERSVPGSIEAPAEWATYLLTDSKYSGYDLDPIQVELGLPIDLLLYQRRSNSEDVDLILHTTSNLAPNSGFEYGDADIQCTGRTCFADGFRNDMYEPDGVTLSPVTHRVETLKRPLDPRDPENSINTRILALDNTSFPQNTRGNSSLISYGREVDGQGRYLYAGWMGGANGNGFIGPEWTAEKRKPSHEYIAATPNISGWRHFGEVVTPPDDTTMADLWLLNFDSTGVVWFDDIVFVKLP